MMAGKGPSRPRVGTETRFKQAAEAPAGGGRPVADRIPARPAIDPIQ